MNSILCPPSPLAAALPRKSKVVVLLLCFFLGLFGGHRFYVGRIVTGTLQLLTLGGFGLWTLADLILIALGAFGDQHGNKVI